MNIQIPLTQLTISPLSARVVSPNEKADKELIAGLDTRILAMNQPGRQRRPYQHGKRTNGKTESSNARARRFFENVFFKKAGRG